MKKHEHRAKAKGWLTLFASFLLGCIVLTIDILGLEKATSKLSGEAMNAVVSVFPSVFSVLAYNESAQDEIVVVLLDDAGLKELGEPWPIPHYLHAEVLKRVGYFGPKAIFVDFLFLDRRPLVDRNDFEIRDGCIYPPEKSPLHRITGAIKDLSHIPIFLPAEKDILPDRGILCELDLPNVHPVSVEVRSGPAFQNIYPFSEVHKKCDYADLNTCLPSAAVAIYENLCPKDNINALTTGCSRPMASRPYRGGGFDVIWTRRVDALTACSYDYRIGREDGTRRTVCDPIIRGYYDTPDSEGACSREYDLVSLLKSGLRSWRSRCPPFPTLRLPSLMAASAESEKNRFDPRVSYLSGKIVLIGASFLGASDIIEPPTHEPLPGIYFHAAALENLLAFGNKYKSDTARLLVGNSHLSGAVINVVCLAGLFFLYILFRSVYYAKYKTPGENVPLLFYVLWGSAYAVAIGAFGVLSFRWLDLAAFNWIGLLSLGLLPGLFDRIRGKLEQRFDE